MASILICCWGEFDADVVCMLVVDGGRLLLLLGALIWPTVHPIVGGVFDEDDDDDAEDDEDVCLFGLRDILDEFGDTGFVVLFKAGGNGGPIGGFISRS